MILVKKRYLFTLTLIFCLLVVFGEVKFFMAIQSINANTDLQLKYELENFIFATVVVVLLVSIFFVGFLRGSENVLKRMDRMIQLSEYGKHDISAHMEKLGAIGTKFNYLTYHLDDLNNKKSLKISSLSRIIDFLMDRSCEMLFLSDCQGKIIDYSKKLAQEFKLEEDNITGEDLNGFFVDTTFDKIFQDIAKRRSGFEKDKLLVKIGSIEKQTKPSFIPIMNSENQISNVIIILGQSEHFGLFKNGGLKK
jgi:transcriptional regulator with PAS, ATPase and Fis domain